ncbi:MAG: PKD domain-containing protein [Planctomycetota bacterium]|jgi:hypothetical protein
MISFCRMIGRSFPISFRTAAMATLVVFAAMCIGLTVVAQNPPSMPGQVGQQTITIIGTGHDFDDGAGPGQDDWLGAGDNMCTPCHGVPEVGSSAPAWNHAYDSFTHDGSLWLYAKYDGFDEGVILEFADGGGGNVIVTSSDHGLAAATSITISGTVNYNNTYTVANPANDTFEIVETYVAEAIVGGEKWDSGAASTVFFDDLSDKCLGCHDGTNTLQDYTGYSPQYTDPTGTTAAITQFADSLSDPGDITVVTSAGHPLLVGDHIDITGTTNYNGSYVVEAVTVNEFDIAEEFVGDDATGDWELMDPTPDTYVGVDEDLGVLLSDTHHPVGIDFTAAMGAAEEYLVDPTTTAYAEGTIQTMLLNGNKINCNSCHEQHNDRRYDLIGGDYHDDPVAPFDDDSELHNFLKIYEGGCRLCHTSGSVAAASGSEDHHFPGREDPQGLLRGGNEFSCTMCHNVNGDGGHHRCSDCHIVNGVPQYDPTRNGGAGPFMATGHHGGDRQWPYINCAPCHGDPVTGILTGNDFGTLFAPSCYECHGDNKWAGDDVDPPTWGTPPVEGIVDVNGTPTLDGIVGELVTFQANATDNEGDPLAYTWSFGDGSQAQFPSFDNVTEHAYAVYNFQPRNKPLSPPYNAVVSVTDGKTPPIFYKFQVRIYEAEEHVEDTWTITPAGVVDPDPPFDITFENHSGSLVGTTDAGQLSLGIEFVGVIFWMDVWMDLSGNAFWGTGDMYFGNVSRGDPGSMDGVIFKSDGSVQLFTGLGGAPPGGH